MTSYLFYIFVLVVLAFPISVIITIMRRSRRAKRRSPSRSLNGSTGQVVARIAPYGAVLVNGELWPARSYDGNELADGATVTVVEPRGHALIVTPG